MTPEEAREILQRSRPGVVGTAEPDLAAALKLAQEDPELRVWWAAELAWRDSVRAALCSLEPPESLRANLGRISRDRPRPDHRRPMAWLAMAASLAVLLGGALWWRMSRAPAGGFDIWRQRMARTAVREYRMDIATNSLPAVREFFARTTHHATLVVPPGIERLPVVGAAALRFHNQPVSLICFDRGRGQMLWLFTADRAALPDAPSDRTLGEIGDLATAAWSDGGQVYLAAVEGGEQLLRDYLSP